MTDENENISRAAWSLRALADLPPGCYTIPVRGRSMEPTLREGQKILVDIPPPRPPRFGEVVVVRHGELLYVHRLVGRVGDRIRTKGDGRGHFDGWLSAPGEIVGTVRGVAGDGGEPVPEGRRGRLAGCWSALCGHLYRVALRLDAALPGGGYREDVEKLNGAGFRVVSAALPGAGGEDRAAPV